MNALLLMLLVAAPDPVVARAGDSEITAIELRQRIGATQSQGGQAMPDLLVQDLVNEALLAQDGARLGLQRDPAVVAAVDTARRKAAGERLLEVSFADLKITEAQLVELYHSSADSVRMMMTVFATEPEARAALQRLEGGAKFADEVKHSLDPATANRGGDTGLRSRGQLPKTLADAAFAAKPEAFSGPVALEIGFAVIQVLEREIGDPKAFAEKRDELRVFAEKQLRAQMRSHFVEQLRKQAKTTVDEDFLKSTGSRLQGTEQEMEHVVVAVGERKIRFAEVAAEVRRLFGGKEAGHASGPGVKTEMAWSLADRLLLGNAALERKLGDDPAVRTAARAAEKSALVQLVSSRLRAEAPKAGAAEIEAYYQSHAAEFQRPARHRCSHILVGMHDEADKLAARLQRGEAFADLARDYSRDLATAAKGGEIGELPEDRLDELAKTEPALAAVLRTASGTGAMPVKSHAGWHLVRCAPVLPAAPMPLAEVSQAIGERASASSGDDAVRTRIAGLRAASHIEVVPAAMRSIANQ